MVRVPELKIGDRVRFDGKRTSWLVRGIACKGRYVLLTAAEFGRVYYTIIDTKEGIRGAMNISGHGLSIFTTKGDDPAITEALRMLDSDEQWEVSRRNHVPLNISLVI